MVSLKTENTDPLALVMQSPLGGLDVRRFECMPNCGRCCGYKVSLLETDITRLDRAGLTRGQILDPTRAPADGFAACLAKRNGACALLDGEKRCTVYANRPLYCRLYPYIREAYSELQLDVDLSCPGVGQGTRLPESELAEILRRDGAEGDHARLLESGRRAMETAGRFLGFRADQEPFHALADSIQSAAEEGLSTLKDFLRSGAPRVARRLLPQAEPAANRHMPLDEEAGNTLRDYLVLWSKRQALWRWADAFAAVTPGVRTRKEATMRFLIEVQELVQGCAGGIARGRRIDRESVLDAIRQYDSFCRTYCHGFRLNSY